ncbi:hypothetical protein BH09ACT8_BH09ACT8_48160 [soil metagenome]
MADGNERRELNRTVLQRAMNGISRLSGGDVRAELYESMSFQLPYESAVSDQDRAGFVQLLEVMFEMFKQFDSAITHIYDLVDRNTLVAPIRQHLYWVR